MRNLLIIFVCALGTGLMAGSVSASYYNIDISPGTKTFATEVTVSEGSNITIDIYLSGISEAQKAGGCWVDFSSSTGQLSYVSAGRALSDGSEGITGPWTPTTGVLLNEPDGAGTLMMVVANLAGASPDGDGDLPIGRVTLNCTGDATITISTVPLIATWTPEDDANVVNGNITIDVVAIDSDADGIPFDLDNCPTRPNGPAKGSCFNYFTHEVWGECLDHGSCQDNSAEWYKWCDTTQGDQDDDGTGDVCDDVSFCGNNLIERSEICDGSDLGGETCEAQGYSGGGVLSCLSDCSGFDVSECIGDSDGDGIADDIDNCPTIPNGPFLGTCYPWSGVLSSCTSDDNCGGSPDSCSMDQEDADEDTIGDVCDLCTDFDGDKYGRETLDNSGCTYTEYDCNDNDQFINPGANEVCDGIDNDCGGTIDEDLTQSCGTGVCQGTQTCSAGSWSNCSTYDNECADCALCSVIGECSAFMPSTTICRVATGDCDIEETCTGASPDCPSNEFLPPIQVCREAVGDCDVAETCTGSSANCPTDMFKDSSYICRAEAGDCDIEETCTGVSTECPPDNKSVAECRASVLPCDIAEYCNGSSNSCPVDSYQSVGTDCDDGIFCNGVDTCDGSGSCVHAGDPCILNQECNTTCNETPKNCYAPAGMSCSEGECDGYGNCQTDLDADGILNYEDNCPATPNGPDGGTCYTGKTGNPCMSHGDCGCGGECSMDQEDADEDEVGNVCDNCPEFSNTDQNDTDGDDVGDTCDNCQEVSNSDQLDSNTNCPAPPYTSAPLCGDACEDIIPCGNNVIDGTEVCDGTDLGGETCETQGFGGGVLSCLSDCSGFDVSECIEDVDGDGVPDDEDNCLSIPNGPAKGSCFNYVTHEVWGECLDDGSCQDVSGEWWKWCDTIQADQDDDGTGDVCDPTPQP